MFWCVRKVEAHRSMSLSLLGHRRRAGGKQEEGLASVFPVLSCGLLRAGYFPSVAFLFVCLFLVHLASPAVLVALLPSHLELAEGRVSGALKELRLQYLSPPNTLALTLKAVSPVLEKA